MKYQYAPGLPGYGTQGADGSNGMLGISTYFTDMDGTSDSLQLKSQIANDYILQLGSTTSLPGYPSRTYQTGDIFIDKNGRAYEIDLTTPNLYSASFARLNTSSIFVEQFSTDDALQTYERYSNSFSSGSFFLVDNVYVSSPIADYAQAPATIYGVKPKDFGQIKYVDSSIATTIPGNQIFQPFVLWSNTINTDEPWGAIALVKQEDSSSHWRLGNIDLAGNPLDVSLSLDFKDIHLNGDTEVDGGITANTATISGHIYPGDDILFSTTTDHNIKFNGTSTTARNLTLQGSQPPTSGAAYNAGKLEIRTHNGSVIDVTTGFGGVGGDVSIYAGNGGKSNLSSHFQTGVKGGAISLKAGDAGYVYGDYDDDLEGADGAGIGITAGKGSDAENVNSNGDAYAGDGGAVIIRGGIGGNGINGDTYYGGNGGAASLIGGVGGNGSSYGRGGTAYVTGGTGYNGGHVYINPGNGNTNGNIYISTTTTSNTYVGGPIYVPDGTLLNPTIRFTSNNDVGFYRYNLDAIGFALGNANGRKAFYMSNGVDGAYLASLDCSTVIQPQTTGTEENGYGVEIVSRTAGGHGGPVAIRTASGVADHNGGNINITSGNGGSGFTFGGDITIQPGTGSLASGKLKLLNLLTSIGTDYLEINGSNEVSRNGNPSDIKYKDIISTIENSLDIVMSLNGYKFTWNETSEELFDEVDHDQIQIGLVAQELEEVLPELVTDVKREDKGISYKQIKYNRLAPLLVEAIKEQQSQIEDLKAIVEKQQDQINKLLELNNLK